MSVNLIDKTTGDLTKIAGSNVWADNPIGSIIPYGGATAPSGYLLCDGSAISRTKYAELFAVIGTSFGAGDGSTTFNLPDLREATTKGVGLSGKSSTHYDSDGVALGEFVEDRIKSHSHGIPLDQNSGSVVCCKSITANGNTSFSRTETVGSATNEVKAVGVNYIIKANMVAVPSDFMSKVDEAVEEANDYSTTETVVGKWINGKTIYRKVISLGTLPATTMKTVDTGISNISFVISFRGTAYKNQDFIPLPYPNTDGNNVQMWIETPSGSTSIINIRTIGDWSDRYAWAIIEYTKTT